MRPEVIFPRSTRVSGRALQVLVLAALLLADPLRAADNPWVVYAGVSGPGKGKHVVLISGDEEYRSEEGLPQLGKILANHHGFRCTVLFAIDRKDGTINPAQVDNIPGLDALATADLMIIATRFRALPDEQMKYIDEYVQSGRPVIGLRTATHAFKFPGESPSKYKHYDWADKTWAGGFGKQVLGETWISHHGVHGSQSTRGAIVPEMKGHPILRGVGEVWGPTDVYTVQLPLSAKARPLVMGQVLEGMNPTDKPVSVYVRNDRKTGAEIKSTPNDPMMPVAWTHSFTGKSGKTSRVFTTTMGSSVDLANEGLRRMLVNAAYWCIGLEDKIPPKANVGIVGEYKPTPFGFGKHTAGVKPSAHAK